MTETEKYKLGFTQRHGTVAFEKQSRALPYCRGSEEGGRGGDCRVVVRRGGGGGGKQGMQDVLNRTVKMHGARSAFSSFLRSRVSLRVYYVRRDRHTHTHTGPYTRIW